MNAKSGQCHCGAVKFMATPKPYDDGVHIEACHCGICRRRVGGPLLGVTLAKAPEIEDETHLCTYQSSDWAERQFCKNCGTNLFYRLKASDFHTVHAGALDDLSDAKLALEIFIDNKPSYYDFAQETQKMTEQQVMAMFALAEGAS